MMLLHYPLTVKAFLWRGAPGFSLGFTVCFFFLSFSLKSLIVKLLFLILAQIPGEFQLAWRKSNSPAQTSVIKYYRVTHARGGVSELADEQDLGLGAGKASGFKSRFPTKG